MKKELLASVLTLTAGMASTVSFPQQALARSTIVEQQFAKTFKLKLDLQARHTNDKGEVILGHIYLYLQQEPMTPTYSNLLHGEMTGSLYFESDEYTHSYQDHQYKTIVPLTGDDGEVLLDMTNKDKKNGNKYQIYGCNSTQTLCSADSYEVEILTNKTANMTLKIAADLKVEINHIYNDGKSEWLSFGYDIPMVEAPVEK
ncbi:hypothetical protein [Bdellovibrio sp. BCCA]|uniref:hypothetical protein n=1 Tax=Bdellovibrio sp. BCCA TaxID=3136281 RepID=UPI0030F25607